MSQNQQNVKAQESIGYEAFTVPPEERTETSKSQRYVTSSTTVLAPITQQHPLDSPSSRRSNVVIEEIPQTPGGPSQSILKALSNPDVHSLISSLMPKAVGDPTVANLLNALLQHVTPPVITVPETPARPFHPASSCSGSPLPSMQAKSSSFIGSIDEPNSYFTRVSTGTPLSTPTSTPAKPNLADSGLRLTARTNSGGFSRSLSRSSSASEINLSTPSTPLLTPSKTALIGSSNEAGFNDSTVSKIDGSTVTSTSNTGFQSLMSGAHVSPTELKSTAISVLIRTLSGSGSGSVSSATSGNVLGELSQQSQLTPVTRTRHASALTERTESGSKFPISRLSEMTAPLSMDPLSPPSVIGGRESANHFSKNMCTETSSSTGFQCIAQSERCTQEERHNIDAENLIVAEPSDMPDTDENGLVNMDDYEMIDDQDDGDAVEERTRRNEKRKTKKPKKRFILLLPNVLIILCL